MGIGYKIGATFDHGGGGVVGKIGYWIVMSILFVVLLPVSLIALPFIKLSERRAARRTQRPGSYDLRRID